MKKRKRLHHPLILPDTSTKQNANGMVGHGENNFRLRNYEQTNTHHQSFYFIKGTRSFLATHFSSTKILSRHFSKTKAALYELEPYHTALQIYKKNYKLQITDCKIVNFIFSCIFVSHALTKLQQFLLSKLRCDFS